MDLINTQVDFEIGTVIEAIASPSADWKCADGQILDQADYPEYCAIAQDLHPKCYERLQYWTERTYAPKSCTRMGDILVVVGQGVEVLYTDDAGDTWNVNSPLGGSSSDYYYTVTNNGSIIVTLRYNSATAYTTTDGSSWTSRSLTQTKNWNYLIWTGNYFVATSMNTSPRPLDYSTDGINWYAASWPDNSVNFAYVCGGNNYLIYWSYSDYKWHRSSDGGQNWSTASDIFQWLSPNYQGLYPGTVTFDGTYFNLWFNTVNNNFWLRSSNGFDWWPVPFIQSKFGSTEFWPSTGNYDGTKHIFMMTGYSRYYPIWYIAEDDARNFQPRTTTINTSLSQTSDIRNRIAVIPGVGMFMVGNNGSDIELWADFTEYDSSTKFQLPVLSQGLPSGIKKYIKMK